MAFVPEHQRKLDVIKAIIPAILSETCGEGFQISKIHEYQRNLEGLGQAHKT
jgi:hypothetical protein